jgi:hypothetical protein
MHHAWQLWCFAFLAVLRTRGVPFLERPSALLHLCASWNARLPSCLSALLGTAACPPPSLRFLERPSALLPLCASWHGRLPSCLTALLGTAVCPHASLRFFARPSALMPLCASWHGSLPSCLSALLGTAVCPHASVRFLARLRFARSCTCSVYLAKLSLSHSHLTCA